MIVQRRRLSVRALDAKVAGAPGGRGEAVGDAVAAAVLDAGRKLAVAAAIEIDRPGVVELRLGGDIYDAGGAQAVLGGEGAGDQRHLAREPWTERLSEDAEALRQDHAVEAELQAVVLAADMELAKAVLRDAGGLQDHGVEGDILAAGRRLDGLGVDRIDRCAKAGLDLVAGGVQPCVDLHRRDHGRIILGSGEGGGHEGRKAYGEQQ